MNVIALMTVIRNILLEMGEYEAVPMQPGLAKAWCHPDIFFAAKSGAPKGCFVFQTLAGLEFCPKFVWLLPFNNEEAFTKPVKDFLSQLENTVLQNKKGLSFLIRGDECFLTQQGERGCAWQLYFNGLCCGRLELYSELMSEPLPKPWLILNLDMLAFLGLITPQNYLKPKMWAENVPVKNVVSLYAGANAAESPAQSLCSELSRYNNALLGGEFKPDLNKPIINAFNKLVEAGKQCEA